MAAKGVTFEGGEKAEKFFKNAGKGGVRGLDVGFFSSAKYSDGTQVAMVAAIHELGLGVAERPYFTIAMAAAMPKAYAYIKATADPKTMVVTPVMAAKVGEILKGELQRAIRNLRTPPNAESTIKAKTRKGKGEKDNPLIDEGLMRESATYKVVK